MGNAQLKNTDDDSEAFVDELKPGTSLMHGQYVIEKFLNAGGFGITYLAKDSLDRKIVIKECFPGAFCRRSKTIVQARSRAHQPELKSIVRLFVQEARSLSKLTHPNIVGVHQVFEDNDTAYMALDFVEGRDLLDTLEDPDHGLKPDQIKSILTDILGAVGFVHKQNMLHRDISPDNILIDANMRPVLIDFGAAREQATKQSRVLSALRVVKDGYSPQEFYIAGSEQSPSSDLYALGASFYHLIANEVPPNSQARLASIASGEKDPYVPLVDRIEGYDRNFLAALDMSLRVLPKDRVQSAQDWLDMMNGKKPIVAKTEIMSAAAIAEKQKSKMPMLMASVAVIALLGVGVITQTDLLERASVSPSVAPAATAVVAEPVVEETTIAPVVDTAAAVVQEPLEVATPEQSPAVTAPLEEVAAVTPEDPIAVALSETATAEAVAPVEPVIRPALRPANLGQRPLPAPGPTPEIIQDVAETPSLPGFLAGLPPLPDNTTPVLSLPELPADVRGEDVTIALDVPVLVPGNEVIPAAAVTEAEPVVTEAEPVVLDASDEGFYVLSAWSVDLQFSASPSQPAVIEAVAANAPAWVTSGTVIKSVNGTPIESIEEIQTVLRETATLGDSGNITASFEIENDGVVSTQVVSLAAHQEFKLLSGVSFTARNVDGVWQTSVTAVPDSAETDLNVGDTLIADIATGKKIETRTALKDLLDTQVAAGTTQFSFAVNRDASMWVAGLEYNPNPEND